MSERFRIWIDATIVFALCGSVLCYAAASAGAEETAAPTDAPEAVAAVAEVAGPSAEEVKAAELKDEIRERAAKIAELEAEINKTKEELNKVGAERQTLERAVATIDLSRRKITANISLTEERIKGAETTIGDISLSIEEKEKRISLNEGAIAETLRAMNEADVNSSLEVMLGASNFSDLWDVAERAVAIQQALRSDVLRLKELRDQLAASKDTAVSTKNQLAALKRELSGEKQSLDVTRLEKQDLLKTTKSQESEYQKLLREKQAAREQFEKELAQLEAELQFTFDAGAIPRAGSGVLSWPFENAYMKDCLSFEKALKNIHCITQYFGNTPFAKLGSYNGKGHNGVDFRAPPGTRITAAASGRVLATGNTDAVRGCYSYGKWALVDHGNGLSTLYAHLSGISVGKGDVVVRGDLVGFSGSTGYSTGPHLHFTVYASTGIEVRTLGGKTPCARATIPIAATEAYLNPMQYL